MSNQSPNIKQVGNDLTDKEYSLHFKASVSAMPCQTVVMRIPLNEFIGTEKESAWPASS